MTERCADMPTNPNEARLGKPFWNRNKDNPAPHVRIDGHRYTLDGGDACTRLSALTGHELGILVQGTTVDDSAEFLREITAELKRRYPCAH